MFHFLFKGNFLYPIILVLLLGIACFNIFYKLGTFPIYSWDEARHGVNAYEMLRKGNFNINTYRDQIDYWNLKPPVSFWANIAGFKLVGFNALGLRLVSAISALITMIIVAVFVNMKHGKLASLLTTLTLATCTQFLLNHGARTGDADSLFILFFTSAILSLLLSDKHLLWLYISGFAFAMAFLTKSWHAGNIAIIIGTYLIFTQKYKQLSLRNWIIFIIFMLLPILIWGWLRYQYDGMKFIKLMFTYDLLQRSSTPIERHLGGKLYYFQVLWKYSYLWLIVFCGLIIMFLFSGLKQINSQNIAYILGIAFWLVIPIILFSIAKTKIRWYVLPIYPPISIIIGTLASKVILNGKLLCRIGLLFSILIVSIHYEWEIINYLNNPTPKLQLNLIQKLHYKDRIKGASLFIKHTAGSEIPQNIILTAELYGNFHVEDGDTFDFLKKDGALLLLKKDHGSAQIIRSNHLKIISSNKWGYIVCKQ
jgi:4-amino-4-deoxy-L-arabinose transferase-like glycosyltransferase